jgi:hypothetical protein
MPGVTMLTYDAALARVQIDLTAVRTAIGTDDTGTVERSADQVRWVTVRGGADIALTASAPPLSDYEFADGQVNYYRVVPTASVYTDDITPSLAGQVWLKSIRYPFLNLPVEVTDVSDVTRPARSGTFDVMGRSAPVAVTAVRGARNYSLTVVVDDAGAAALVNVDYAPGEVVFLQPPDGSELPGGYYLAGDTTETIYPVSGIRLIAAQLAEVAAPGPDVTGTTIIWQGVIDAYATWSALLADQATWADVLQTVGTPADVIVP